MRKIVVCATRMDYQQFYKQLFEPIEERIGHVDEARIMALIGFDFGGPVTLCTVGYGPERFVTYFTCKLSVRDEQQPAEFGRYEVMMTCDDETWARKILTKIGQMSLESVFEHGHTVDIGKIVAPDCPMQGLVVEEFSRVIASTEKLGCRLNRLPIGLHEPSRRFKTRSIRAIYRTQERLLSISRSGSLIASSLFWVRWP